MLVFTSLNSDSRQAKKVFHNILGTIYYEFQLIIAEYIALKGLQAKG